MMKPIIKGIGCLLGLLIGPAMGWAQAFVVVSVETNMPEALVYADSLRLGPASLQTFRVPPDTRLIRLLPPSGDAWSVAPVSMSIQAAAGDALSLQMPFPYHYHIESIPYGAVVYQRTRAGRVALGHTPLLYTTGQPLEGSLVVERPGFVPEEVQSGQAVWNHHVVSLAPLRLEEEAPAAHVIVPSPRRRRWIDVTAASVAAVAGGLAVHFKFKADRIDDRYRQTGDPRLRAETRVFDTRAAVALGAMQAGVGVLALRFVLK